MSPRLRGSGLRVPRNGRGAAGAPLVLLTFAVIALITGLSLRQAGVANGPTFPASGERDALHLRADQLLAAWADASSAGSAPAFVGDLTGQTGDWEEAVGDNNKPALMAGLLMATPALSTESPPDGVVRWSDGRSASVPLTSAAQALTDMTSQSFDSCGDCTALVVTGATLMTVPVETTRGPAIAPAWRFTLAGTGVTVTRVAVAHPIAPTSPPPFPQEEYPAVRSTESATGRATERNLVVQLVGAPAPASERCGADYTAEAVESQLALVVIVTEHANPTPGACRLVGATRTAVMELTSPLGDRAVIDVVQGVPIPLVVPSIIPDRSAMPAGSTSSRAPPSTTSLTVPSPVGPTDAAVALEFVRKFEDGLTTGHADSSWRFLSPWSQASVGSFAEFERRYAWSTPPAVPLDIGPPSQDPELLSRAFLGPRADDIAAHAVAARTFLVPVRDPSVDGSAASTTNLIVAPIEDGTWQIWLDR